jgi:hypothetical protein
MKKIIISISIMASMSCTKNYEEKLILDETIGWVQDMREWMSDDINNGIVPIEYGEYYLMGLDHCESRLIALDSINRL